MEKCIERPTEAKGVPILPARKDKLFQGMTEGHGWRESGKGDQLNTLLSVGGLYWGRGSGGLPGVQRRVVVFNYVSFSFSHRHTCLLRLLCDVMSMSIFQKPGREPNVIPIAAWSLGSGNTLAN